MPGWAKDPAVKKDGEKILNNYKKQLAERLAREAAERKSGQKFSRSNTGTDKASHYSKGSRFGGT